LTAEQTGKSVEQINKDADRDRWFTADEALKYGFIDKVVTHESEAGPRAESASKDTASKDAGGKA
jgi:ATP-dependent Clp protease protease subunit